MPRRVMRYETKATQTCLETEFNAAPPTELPDLAVEYVIVDSTG